MGKKGFTLIELLAVIIILGILMIIAIPSVTSYISDSRKNSYIDTAKEVIGGARNLVNDGSLELFDTGTTYYLDVNCINTENALKSPYGDFVKAYVVVTYNGNGYEYYWTSVDDAGEGIRGLVRFDKLEPELIESDLTPDDINTSRGIDGRVNIQLVNKSNNCQKANGESATQYLGADGTDLGVILYPTGKNESGLQIGDIVRIGNQEFFFVKYDNGHKVLLARYNLKVGHNMDLDNGTIRNEEVIPSNTPGYGLQSPEMIGVNAAEDRITGAVSFSETKYWQATSGYVYNSNSNLYPYINDYENYIEGLGVEVVESRVASWEEINLFDTAHKYSIISNGTYWCGTISPYGNNLLDAVLINNRDATIPYYHDAFAGVRPVIVIE